ncbi:MAG TPA: glycosyltransferase family 4 protein [Gemmatimonadaceae bacterium]|nr:glycosyltransferase family 4 protein [Gemmatimonadaceae bacterium]
MPHTRLHVVHVCRRFSGSSGGTTTSVRQFQSALGGQIVAFQDAADDFGNPNVVSVRCDPGWLGQTYGWADHRALASARCVLDRADLVVCHMLLQYHAQWAAKHARELGIPYWIVPHGTLDPYVFSYRAMRKRWWMKLVGERLVHESARVLFATRRESAKAESVVGRLHNTSTLPWPVQSIPLADKAERRAAIRRTLGIPESERVLLYVGRLQRMKRLIETVKAVGSAPDHGVSLIVVGPDGDLKRSEIEEFCQASGWSNIRFTGPIYGNELFDFYKAADGFISLSMKENFGHSVAEALAAGLPIILSPSIDLVPEITDVRCGWTLASTSEETVAKAIHDFWIASPELLAELGARGRHWVRTVLSPAAFEEHLRRLAFSDVSRYRGDTEHVEDGDPV